MFSRSKRSAKKLGHSAWSARTTPGKDNSAITPLKRARTRRTPRRANSPAAFAAIPHASALPDSLRAIHPHLPSLLPPLFSVVLLCDCESVEGTGSTGRDAAVALGTPISFSGDPGRDARALGGSNRIVQLADWGRMSAGQNWSKIFGKHQVYGEKGFTAKASPPPRRARNIPTFHRPDGKIQIYYRLEHFGGVNVSNSRKTFNDNSVVTVTPNQLEPLVKVVQAHLGEQGTVSALPSENVLVITCAKAAQDSVMQLMEQSMVPSVPLPGRSVAQIHMRMALMKHKFGSVDGRLYTTDGITRLLACIP